jgi:hypothetical protein
MSQSRVIPMFGPPSAHTYKAAAKAHIEHNRTAMPSSPSKPLDTPLQFPGQSENDSPTRPVSNSPRELVRRVVERTSDKLGRSKSLGSKLQYSPKTQHTSSNGTSKRFVSQDRKGKDPQTASTGDLGGTFNTCPSYASCALDLPMF